jgi:hypothetical protein
MKYGEKSKESLDGATQEFESFNPPSVASRARNRTVMLSPDVTGQVRSLLQAPMSSNRTTSLSEDPFQKPNNSILEKHDDTLIDVKKRQENVTKAHTGTAHSTIEMSDHYTSKVEKVEGTLELQREHTKRVNADRKFEELGIGLAKLEEPFREVMPKELSSNILNRNILAKEILPVKKEFETLRNDFDLGRKEIEPVIKPTSRVVGFLISYDKDDNGEIIEIRVGRWLVSSKKSREENVIYIDDETISPLHAVVKVSNIGDIQVMDQLSDNGSGILRINSSGELDASISPIKLQHADLVRFGKRYFVFCGVPKMQIES